MKRGGSAAIAHAAAKTKEPIREGIVALLEPFIDTVVICNMTALVMVITGTYDDGLEGVAITKAAFSSVISWFPIILTLAVFWFAFSTMISWSDYGERCWAYLFSNHTIQVYRGIYVVCLFIGSVVNLGAIIDFTDRCFSVWPFLICWADLLCPMRWPLI
jgi:AGCS family alanine or glycine:cation symporter